MITNINIIIFKEILSKKSSLNFDKKQVSQVSSIISSSFFEFLLPQKQENIIILL